MAKLIFVDAVAGTTGAQSFYDEEQERDVVQPGGETFIKTAIPVDAIQSFSERKPQRDGTPRVGTRIVFKNDSGGRMRALPVKQSFDEVADMYVNAVS